LHDTNPQEEAYPDKEVRESLFENAFSKSPLFMTILEKLKELHPLWLVGGGIKLIVGPYGYKICCFGLDRKQYCKYYKEDEKICITRYDESGIYITAFLGEHKVHETFFKGLSWSKKQ
jgi:hypothetical protein